jgi:hypothetical protein
MYADWLSEDGIHFLQHRRMLIFPLFLITASSFSLIHDGVSHRINVLRIEDLTCLDTSLFFGAY